MKEVSLLTDKTLKLAQELNQNVSSVINPNDGLIGFERSFLISSAILKLKSLLTKEYMEPIMALQGNKLGFQTDKDDSGGYKEDVVKNCLIEAVLTGLEPFGNHFNIIAGQMYPTKNGFGHLLRKFPGLTYEIVPGLPRINADKTGAAVPMTIEWTLNGVTKTKVLDIAVKTNSYGSVDSVTGKATRKARAWLYNTISGSEIELADGDVQDIDHKVVHTKTAADKEEDRLLDLIKSAPDVGKLSTYQQFINSDKLKGAYELRESELLAAKPK